MNKVKKAGIYDNYMTLFSFLVSKFNQNFINKNRCKRNKDIVLVWIKSKKSKY